MSAAAASSTPQPSELEPGNLQNTPFAGTIYDFEHWGDDDVKRVSDALVGTLGATFELGALVGKGSTGIVFQTPNPNKVVKLVLDDCLVIFNKTTERFYFPMPNDADFRLARAIGELGLGPKVYQFGKLSLTYRDGEQDDLENRQDIAYTKNTSVDEEGRNDYFTSCKNPSINDHGIDIWYLLMDRLYDLENANDGNGGAIGAKRNEIEAEIQNLYPRAADFEFGFAKEGSLEPSDLRAFDLLLNDAAPAAPDFSSPSSGFSSSGSHGQVKRGQKEQGGGASGGKKQCKRHLWERLKQMKLQHAYGTLRF